MERESDSCLALRDFRNNFQFRERRAETPKARSHYANGPTARRDERDQASMTTGTIMGRRR